MSQSSSSTELLSCPQCGATLGSGATDCWLCHVPLDRQRDSTLESAAPMRSDTPASVAQVGNFSLASLMMFVTLLCVALGVSTIAPGIGIPLGIVFIVVWLRTTAVTRQRAARGLAVTSLEKVQLFAASLGVTVGLLSLVGVAGFAAFWAACFACIGTYFGLEPVAGEGFAMPVAWIVCGLVVLAVLFVALKYVMPAIVRFVRRRWQRDIGKPD
jgi:hypothetical protein